MKYSIKDLYASAWECQVKITGFKTFGVKKLAKVVDSEELKIFNVFGFGLWIIK